jgi:hypothetical protein
VIRFNCPHCDRHYELPEALARLALVCKGCGQSLSVPEKSAAPDAPLPSPPPPSPPPPRVPIPPPMPAPVKIDLPPAPSSSPPPLPPRPAVVAVAANESRLPPSDKPFTNGPPAAHPKVDALFERPDALAVLDEALPVAAPFPPEEPRRRNIMGAIVDVLVAFVLVAVGVFAGELLARQSCLEVLRNAASAAKFPPVDLLMWLAPTLLLLLVYALLISRGKSVGNLVGRRREA